MFEGTLADKEINFLLNYSINDLVSAGVQFYSQPPEGEEDEDDQQQLDMFEAPEQVQ